MQGHPCFRLHAALLLAIALHCAAADYSHSFADGKGDWNGVVRDGALVHEMGVHKPGSYLAAATPLPVSPGERFIYEAEVNIPQPLRQGVYRLQAVFLNDRGGLVSSHLSTESADSSRAWRRLSMPLAVPVGATRLQLRLVHNGVGRVLVRRVACRPPAPGSFDAGRFPAYAGTLEEQKILQGMSLKTGGDIPPSAHLDYDDRPAPSRYSVRFQWANPAERPASGTVESALPDLRPPGSPRRAVASVSLWMRVHHRGAGKLHLDIRFRELLSGYGDAQNRWTARIPLEKCPPGGTWTRFEFTPADFQAIPGNSMPEAWGQIEPATIFFDVEGRGEAAWSLADVRVRYDDGGEAMAFAAWQDSLWYFGRADAPAPMLPALEGRNVHGSGTYLLETERGRRNFQELKKLVPNLAFQQYACLPELLRAREWLRKSGMTAGFQGVGPFLWQRAVELDALAAPRDSYQFLNERHHKMDYTDDASWHTIWKEVAGRFGKYGIPEFQTIDSGFRVADAKVNRNAPRILRHEDIGIAPPAAAASRAPIHFWDYFEWYAGFRWTPADLGWKTWDDYRVTPPNLVMTAAASPRTRQRAYLDFMLRHYAFLRWHADASKSLAEQGVRYILMNNGDDWRNGNDCIGAVRLGHLGGFVEETFFYHPATVLKAYHQAETMRLLYEGSGLHHRLIAESGKNGHNPIYWAPEYSYAAIFDIAAAGNYDSLEIDWPSAWMEVQTRPENRYDFNRYLDYLAKCLAFNRARAERPRVPPEMRRLLILQETRASYAGPRARVLGQTLERDNWPFSRITPQLLDDAVLGHARMIVNDCYALTQAQADTLAAWVDAAPGRILVLHGVSAGRRIDGTMWSEVFGWSNTTINAPRLFDRFFGALSFRNGHVVPKRPGTVVFKDASGDPLLCCVRRPSGSIVWLYAMTPGMDRARDSRILASLMRRHGISPVAESTGDLYVRKYLPGFAQEDKTGVIFTAFARQELDSYKWVYAAQDNGLYPWRLPEERRRAAVAFARPGRYRLLAMLSGKEQAVTVGKDGKVPLELAGVSAEVFYLVPEESRQRLEGLRAHRNFLREHIVGKMQPE